MSRFFKPRPPRGFTAKLTPEQRAELLEWLMEPTNTYAQVVKFLRERFGVATSQTALGHFYKKHTGEIARPALVPAAGVSVTITCVRPGEVKLAVYPLQRAEIDAAEAAGAELRASGVEVITHCAADSSIKLGVFPVATPAT